MKKTSLLLNISVLLLILPVFITKLHAGENQKVAVLISDKNIQPGKYVKIKCERKDDDMGQCLSCHGKNGWMDKKYIHGPLAINDCRPCHVKPDKTIMEKAEIDFKKDPCNFCHQKDEIIKAHPETLKQQKLNCLTCHNPHASDKEYFLR